MLLCANERKTWLHFATEDLKCWRVIGCQVGIAFDLAKIWYLAKYFGWKHQVSGEFILKTKFWRVVYVYVLPSFIQKGSKKHFLYLLKKKWRCWRMEVTRFVTKSKCVANNSHKNYDKDTKLNLHSFFFFKIVE